MLVIVATYQNKKSAEKFVSAYYKNNTSAVVEYDSRLMQYNVKVMINL